MIKPEQPRIEIDELTAVIRESMAAQKHENGSAVISSTPDNHVQSVFPELKLQPDFQPRSNNRYHIGGLLRYHDRAFVENAYRAILKRPPDATELARDLKRIRTGEFNKVDLLATLRYANEGKAKGVEVEGLTVPALVRRLGQLPIAGYFVRLAIALVRLPNQIRDQREFAGYVLSQNQQIADFVNVMSARISGTNQGLARVEEKLSAQMHALNDEQRGARETIEHNANERFDALVQQLDTHATEIQQQADHLKSIEPRFESRIGEEKKLLQDRIEQLQRLSDLIQVRTEQLQTTIKQEASQLQEKIDHWSSQQQKSGLQQRESVAAAATELRAEIERVYRQLQQARTELSLQGRNLNSLLAPQVSPESESATPPVPFDAHRLDALYAALEDRFRGSREEIKDRFRIYLPYVEAARATGDVIDLGCGRGEWLELLTESGIKARGVEMNRVLIEQCRERGLEVVDDDMLAHLRSLPNESARAVTGFHIIEHVSIDALVSLLDEAMRVLRPDGVAIFETPNPENVLVGSNFFYLDPTHLHPLPHELMQFLFESRGFHPIEMLNLHPWDTGRVAGEGELAERFNGYFFGPMDYAILGWKLEPQKAQ
ncbi:MAG TPA: methyltransferase domain-containing protein [Pyrinomonadaceae bacterium]|nr:methyltransferase domain-containing protein [Pyrinomonadaceae bacterium]